MRHYFYVETEYELTPEARAEAYSAFVNSLNQHHKVKSSGYKVNVPDGAAVLVTVGELI